jgi:hypothetical protein
VAAKRIRRLIPKKKAARGRPSYYRIAINGLVDRA